MVSASTRASSAGSPSIIAIIWSIWRLWSTPASRSVGPPASTSWSSIALIRGSSGMPGSLSDDVDVVGHGLAERGVAVDGHVELAPRAPSRSPDHEVVGRRADGCRDLAVAPEGEAVGPW